MSDQNKVAQAAEYLANQYRARKPLDLMTQEFAPQTVDEAYGVQEAFLNLLTDAKGKIGGYKIAYTSPVMQQRAGVTGPCAGMMFASTIVDSPAELQASDYVSTAIECEVGVRLGSDLPASGAPYTRESVSKAIECIMTSFEIVDRREAAGLDGQNPALRAIVTNISNGGAVLGTQITDWQNIDLAASRGTMSINGAQVGEGLGSDVMGHPIEPVAWLANMLAKRGKGLTAGTIIITGSLIPPTPINAGDTATISIDGLGEAHVKIA